MRTEKITKNTIGTFKIEKSNSGKTITVTHICRGKECGRKFVSSNEKINFSEIRRLTLKQKAWEKRWVEIQNKAAFHHSAYAKGYATKDMIGTRSYYKGKFGEGYIEVVGRHPKSNSYHTIEYWIIK